MSCRLSNANANTQRRGVYWNGVGNNYSDNTVTNGPHVCLLGGGNEGTPWSQNDSAIMSGAGSDCLFARNVLDTCTYECGDW